MISLPKGRRVALHFFRVSGSSLLLSLDSHRRCQSHFWALALLTIICQFNRWSRQHLKSLHLTEIVVGRFLDRSPKSSTDVSCRLRQTIGSSLNLLVPFVALLKPPIEFDHLSDLLVRLASRSLGNVTHYWDFRSSRIRLHKRAIIEDH